MKLATTSLLATLTFLPFAPANGQMKMEMITETYCVNLITGQKIPCPEDRPDYWNTRRWDVERVDTMFLSEGYDQFAPPNTWRFIYKASQFWPAYRAAQVIMMRHNGGGWNLEAEEYYWENAGAILDARIVGHERLCNYSE